ncbi:putative membrane protein YphA (DoxX/SURF4 family) [Pedobacter africanus]|uniref:Membrane protein YphA (DoxX/SURF4 family) n=1 Tax=Pedobacter africanus TaxID=151894 RepID=A0ACC6KUC8_9SPHI|nr:MauE/DoxX family redox-associated membrane protein [Pedobacter africanus]MDR6782832.1 putative membrane protein YphA (DoxX/SURF4 family) [Pedobacter africanus]
MKKNYIVNLLSFLLVLLWIYAAINKLMDFEKFKLQLEQSPALTGFAAAIALAGPAIKIITAVLLFIPRTKLIGLYAACGLMVMFALYIIVILNFSGHLPCACDGLLKNMGWNGHLLFNVVFVLIAVTGIILQTRSNNKKAS